MGQLTRLPGRIAAIGPAVVPLPKKAEGFYTSPAWRGLVARRKRDADYFAAVARAKPGERVILDHIVERRDGGADLDPSNTQWLTMGEHQAKTARERRRRVSGEPGGGGRKSGR